MTDLWDELWTGYEFIDKDNQRTGRFDLSRVFDGMGRKPSDAQVKFMERVKAEGDMLKEKATKWDDALAINVKIGNGKPISCVDMAKKLEVIKTYLEGIRDDPVWAEWHDKEIAKELLKILGS